MLVTVQEDVATPVRVRGHDAAADLLAELRDVGDFANPDAPERFGLRAEDSDLLDPDKLILLDTSLEPDGTPKAPAADGVTQYCEAYDALDAWGGQPCLQDHGFRIEITDADGDPVCTFGPEPPADQVASRTTYLFVEAGSGKVGCVPGSMTQGVHLTVSTW